MISCFLLWTARTKRAWLCLASSGRDGEVFEKPWKASVHTGPQNPQPATVLVPGKQFLSAKCWRRWNLGLRFVLQMLIVFPKYSLEALVKHLVVSLYLLHCLVCVINCPYDHALFPVLSYVCKSNYRIYYFAKTHHSAACLSKLIFCCFLNQI